MDDPINGTKFYNRILPLVHELKKISCPHEARWIFNHGSATSIMCLCQRINKQISELKRAYKDIVKLNPGATEINLDSPKNSAEKYSWTMYRFLQLDIILFFITLRSMLDELFKFLLKPYVKTKAQELKKSFSYLCDSMKNGSTKRQIYDEHREYFDSITKDFEAFQRELKDPRDEFTHESKQITVKMEKGILYWGGSSDKGYSSEKSSRK